MFEIRISTEAKSLLLERAASEGFERPGLMVHRQGPKGDGTRTPDGATTWSVERPHPWRAQLGDFETIEDGAEDVHVVDGLRVWLALVPKPGERGVQVSVRDGELYADALPDA
jgi:hypothetical protein